MCTHIIYSLYKLFLAEWIIIALFSLLVTRCPPLPEIANSDIFYTTFEQDLESFPIRTFAIYFCDLNFRSTSGTLARECLSDGSWKGTEPVCSQPGCPDIGDPINGNIVFRTDTTAPFSANTIATYECDQGYKLDSDVSDRICLDDTFVWSGAAFNCIRKFLVTDIVTYIVITYFCHGCNGHY